MPSCASRGDLLGALQRIWQLVEQAGTDMVRALAVGAEGVHGAGADQRFEYALVGAPAVHATAEVAQILKRPALLALGDQSGHRAGANAAHGA